MARPPLPPRIRGRGPTLATLFEIENIIRETAAPLSLNEIKRRMHAKAVRHETVRLAVDELKRRGWVSEGAGGVRWIAGEAPAAVIDDTERRHRTRKRRRMATDLADVPPGETISIGLQLMELGRSLRQGGAHE